ncbi:MAG: DUF418 domain-containing protein [Isosphaeraceae bacterium]
MSLDLRSDRPALEPTPLDTEPDVSLPLAPGAMLSEGEVAAKPCVGPVTATERYFAVDVLRGCALLGILAMNIVDFGWPGAAYSNPTRGGGFEGTDRAIWFFNHLVFEMKMMTIFSMLFGAGFVLMDHRASARGGSIRGVYYRRVLWLLVIGLVHAYLIWDGDILVAYAETGLFLYLFRRLTPRTLIILGISALMILVPIILGVGAAVNFMKAATVRVEAQIKANQKPTWLDQKARDFWTRNLEKELKHDPETLAKKWAEDLAIHRGGYFGIVKNRAPRLLMAHTIGFLLGGGLFAASRMLVGMGLMKLGVFSAQRSRRFYFWLVALGYGIGLPLMVYDAIKLIQNEFSFDYLIMHGGIFYNAFGSLVVALGHVGMLMLVVQSGAIGWLTTRLAAVGRMALSNYLTHSLVCTTLFYGYGFGLFGHINRTGLAGIVLFIWFFQLVVSPIWLKHFRFGPAEWLWRSLTYWKIQPFVVGRPEVLGIAS